MNRLKWRIHGEPRALYWESPSDSDTAIVIVPQSNGALQVTVSEEQALDSCNAYFDCSITLPKAQTLKLRDMLNELFPA